MSTEHDMIESRPSLAYFLLLVLSLAGWCLHDPARIIGAVLVLGFVLLSYRVPLTLKPRLLSIGLTCLLSFAFCHFVWYAGQTDVHVSIYSFPVVQSLCLSLVLLSALQWVSWRSRRFDWLLFSLGSLLMLSGVSWQALQLKLVYMLLALAFTALLLVFRLFPGLRTHHGSGFTGPAASLRSYYLRMGVLVLMFLGLSLSAMRTTEFLDQHFSEMLTRFLMGSERDWSGFSGHTYLQGGKEIQLSDQIAFTVSAPRDLPYWRGAVLTVYREGHWFPQETLHLPVAAKPQDPDWERYRVEPQLARGDGELIDVRMQDHYHGILFMPQGATQIEVPKGTSLYQNQFQLFRRELRGSKHQYRLHLDRKHELAASWDRGMLAEQLEIDTVIAAQLRPLARKIVGDAADPLEQARRIEAWFQQNFTYSLKVDQMPPGRDPTVEFVLGRKAAYCSWFASGMTLMLRSIGVPSHLVSGWRGMDWNPLARVWIVKEKEAHDWVEVLDQGRNRWVRYDPTPPGQIAAITGSGTQDGWFAQLGDGLKLLIQRLQLQLGQMSLQQRLEWLRGLAFGLLRQPVFYLALLLLLGLNQLLKLRRRKQLLEPAAPSTLSYAGAPSLAGSLERLNAWLQPRHASLPETETLDAWLSAQRSRLSPDEAEALALVIGHLQALRFGPEHQAEAAQARLDAALAALPPWSGPPAPVSAVSEASENH